MAIVMCTIYERESVRKTANYVVSNRQIPAAFLAALKAGNNEFIVYPGEYDITGSSRTLELGSNAVLKGAVPIVPPTRKDEMLYPDPTKHAVFRTTTDKPESQPAATSECGYLTNTEKASGFKIQDIVLSGYVVCKIREASRWRVDRLLVHNYIGTYPNGHFCNMGYGRATGSFWLYKNNSDFEVHDLWVQCSSHHGACHHSGTRSYKTVRGKYYRPRFLYCGCGQLQGEGETAAETAAIVANSKAMVPEFQGHGYRDWGVSFDINEQQTSEEIDVYDGFALEGWKGNYYIEPQASGGPVKNIRLWNCVGVRAGKRALFTRKGVTYTRYKEGEGSNFCMFSGDMHDCISVDAVKAGFYVIAEKYPHQSATERRMLLERCVDVGSHVGLDTEMNGTGCIDVNDCTFADNPDLGARLYGSEWIHIRNLRVKAKSASKSPILIGRMERMFFKFSVDPDLANQNNPTAKYGVLRAEMKDLSLTGYVQGLNANVPAAVCGADSINGAPGSQGLEKYAPKLTLSKSSATPIDVAELLKGIYDYIPDPGTKPPETRPPWDGDPRHPYWGEELKPAVEATPRKGVAPLTVTFSAPNIRAPDIVSWYTGGSVGGQGNPLTTEYQIPGKYTIVAQAWRDGMPGPIVQLDDYIEVPAVDVPPPPPDMPEVPPPDEPPVVTPTIKVAVEITNSAGEKEVYNLERFI